MTKIAAVMMLFALLLVGCTSTYTTINNWEASEAEDDGAGGCPVASTSTGAGAVTGGTGRPGQPPWIIMPPTVSTSCFPLGKVLGAYSPTYACEKTEAGRVWVCWDGPEGEAVIPPGCYAVPWQGAVTVADAHASCCAEM